MRKEFRSFDDARKFARNLHLKTRTEWKNLGGNNMIPKDIPHDPAKSYKNWKNWQDWLGYEKRYQKKGEFKNFKDARKFVHSLNLKNQKEWRQYATSGHKPKDIPSLPSRTYPDEWTSFGDWLGTGIIHPKYLKFKTFEDAHRFVIQLKLKSSLEWKKYTKSGHKPKNIPSNVNHVYKENWVSWEHWLTGKNILPRGKRLLDFKDARKFARNLKIIGKKEWEIYIKSGKRPSNIPADPSSAYKNKGWISWNDWLGDGNTDPRKIDFKTYDDAKKIVKLFNIQSQHKWNKFTKSKQKPFDIPSNPRQYYKIEWSGWGDWLGTGNRSPQEISKNWLPWKEAKILYQKIKLENNLKSFEDWKKYVKKNKLPRGLPVYPNEVYTEQRVRKMMK